MEHETIAGIIFVALIVSVYGLCTFKPHLAIKIAKWMLGEK